jgi:hypothetical protein
MRRGQDSKEDWLDILGVILGVFERTRNLLEEGLRFYLESELSRLYCSRYSWLVTNES